MGVLNSLFQVALHLPSLEVRELQALVAPNPPQGVLVRGHAGLVINKLSSPGVCADGAREDLPGGAGRVPEARMRHDCRAGQPGGAPRCVRGGGGEP